MYNTLLRPLLLVLRLSSAVLLATALLSCDADDIIRGYDKHFLLPPGTGPGELGVPQDQQQNGDMIPIPPGQITFDFGLITIVDQLNSKIMQYTHAGKLVREHPLDARLRDCFINSLAVDKHGTVHFLATRNNPEGRTFGIWQLKNGKFTELYKRKPVTGEADRGGKTEFQQRVPTGILQLDTERIAVVWHTMTTLRRPNEAGQPDDVEAGYSITHLEILTPGSDAGKMVIFDRSYFAGLDADGMVFKGIDEVQSSGDEDEILVKAAYKPKNKQEMIKRLFLVRLEDGTAKPVKIGTDDWSGLLGMSADRNLFILDRVYVKKHRSRARISIRNTGGTVLSSFVIESKPADSSLGTLFLSREGILFSYEVVRKTIYNPQAGLLFVSWK